MTPPAIFSLPGAGARDHGSGPDSIDTVRFNRGTAE
jgi:hypothetical protein